MKLKGLREDSSKNSDRCFVRFNEIAGLSHQACLLSLTLLLAGVAVDSTRTQQNSLGSSSNVISSLMAVDPPSDESSPARGSSGGERQKLTNWRETIPLLSLGNDQEFADQKILGSEKVVAQNPTVAIAS